jgi:hypothetical protein
MVYVLVHRRDDDYNKWKHLIKSLLVFIALLPESRASNESQAKNNHHSEIKGYDRDRT